MDDPPDPTTGITILNLDRNPLADLPAQDVPTQFKFNKKAIFIRFISINILTIAFLAAIVGRIYFGNSGLMDGITIVIFMLWLFSINNIPLKFWHYPQQIICDQSLIVTYWMGRKVIEVGWEDIWGIDYADPVCKV
ncbi:MAG: hypothetical protein WCF08_10775 [Anaerolineaceae bacterium]